jgi:hypothetical protein
MILFKSRIEDTAIKANLSESEARSDPTGLRYKQVSTEPWRHIEVMSRERPKSNNEEC